MKMKNHLTLIIFNTLFLVNISSIAQTLSPKVQATTGGTVTAGGASLSFTIGETFYTTLQSGNKVLTQGEQQPYILLKILNLKAFIEGYYTGSSQMEAVLHNNYPLLPNNYCDSITVDLHSTNSPYNLIISRKALLLTDGTAQVKFPSSLANGSYYVSIRSRNTIETWGKVPVIIGGNSNFNFLGQ